MIALLFVILQTDDAGTTFTWFPQTSFRFFAYNLS